MTHPAPRPGYQAIAQEIRAEIARGERQPGQRLPSVRMMAASLGVNVNTVARAYAELARDGTIESNRGGGSFVRATASDALIAERRAEQLRAIMAEAVLRSLSLGHTEDEVERAVHAQLEAWHTAAVQHARPAHRPRPGLIQFAGSHDLALELLATRLRHATPPVDLQLTFTGSTAGLMALLLGQAQIAGCHVGGQEGGDDAATQIQRMLPGQRLVLVTLAHRQQGLIVPPGNPRHIESIRDLAEANILVALRQAGSGTRLLLDRTLALEGLSLTLAEHPVFATHAAVAAAIAEGTANAGLGILAAARTYGLDFVPLTWERYELVIPAELMEHQPIMLLLETLRSETFRLVMDSLGGYDTSVTGEQKVLE
ncbi:MAG: substrate-binding domain-containing protein [Chloroflexota bacterium]